MMADTATANKQAQEQQQQQLRPPAAGRPPPAAGPGRSKSFRKARDAAEETLFLDTSLEDVQKYFSPDTWRKMSGMNLHSVPASSVQKYFDPVAWEKLQRLGCLRGRPSSSATTASSASSASSPMSAAKSCFSPRSWEALARLNVVPPAASPGPQSPSPSRPRGGRPRGEDAEDDDEEEEDDDDVFLERGMGEEGDGDAASLASAVRLDGLEGSASSRALLLAPPRPAVTDRLRQYFSQDQWRKMEERGVLENALRRLAKETSV